MLKKEWLDKIAVAVTAPTIPAKASPGATPAPSATPAMATPKPLPIATTVRPAERMDLFLSGSNGITVYINNKEAITGVSRESASKVRVGLREGDELLVRNADRWDINSFWLSCISSNGQFLFETTNKWTSYIPASELKWWILKGAKQEKPAEYAPERQEYVDRVMKAMKETPLHHGAQPIRSSLHLEGSRATYLHYKVTKDDVLPKPDPLGSSR